jgi:hypothetical protein
MDSSGAAADPKMAETRSDQPRQAAAGRTMSRAASDVPPVAALARQAANASGNPALSIVRQADATALSSFSTSPAPHADAAAWLAALDQATREQWVRVGESARATDASGTVIYDIVAGAQPQARIEIGARSVEWIDTASGARWRAALAVDAAARLTRR